MCRVRGTTPPAPPGRILFAYPPLPLRPIDPAMVHKRDAGAAEISGSRDISAIRKLRVSLCF